MLTPEQLQARKEGIGGSEAAAILDLHPHLSSVEVFLSKTGQLEPRQPTFGDPLYWGSQLEDDVAQGYADFFNVKVRKVNDTLRHPKYNWMLCHLDRKIVGQSKILECKTSDKYNAKLWGECGTDEVPLHYIVQVQHQMAVTGYKEADIAVLIGGNDFRWYAIKRDETLIQELIKREKSFWENYVLQNISPPPSTRFDVSLLYKNDNGDMKEATSEILEKVEKLREIKLKIKDMEEEKSTLENALTIFINEASGIILANQILATWRADKKGKRILRVN